MEFKTIKLPAFTVVGIAVRTNNNTTGQQDIGQLWGQFMSENIAASIPNKVSDEIYSVYTDYESDFNGDYTTIIGCKVSDIDLEEMPEGMVVKDIPETTYQVYEAKGAIPQCVGEAWMKIWQADSEIKRAYVADFDIYGEGAQNPADAQVDIYLSI